MLLHMLNKQTASHSQEPTCTVLDNNLPQVICSVFKRLPLEQREGFSMHFSMLHSVITLRQSVCLDLSLYELHRTPQEAITDDTEITISPRSLHSELMCPICLDMLKNTMTTKEASCQRG